MAKEVSMCTVSRHHHQPILIMGNEGGLVPLIKLLAVFSGCERLHGLLRVRVTVDNPARRVIATLSRAFEHQSGKRRSLQALLRVRRTLCVKGRFTPLPLFGSPRLLLLLFLLMVTIGGSRVMGAIPRPKRPKSHTFY